MSDPQNAEATNATVSNRQSRGNETDFMLDLPENELFSAYIDGELTADEQAEVEQILNDNPEAQQLVDELRSLSTSLQSLPAYKLDEDLAARVLRQAEQEMLGQPAAAPATPLPKFHHVEVPESKPTSWARRLLRPRNFAWSAVAIAVAVVLMLNEPGNGPAPANRIAQGPVTIEPLDIQPTIEAVEAPPAPTVVQATEPDDPKPDEPAPAMPKDVAPTPDPAMVAEKTTETAPKPNAEVIEPKQEANQLLILQCQLAEGRIGHEALAELLMAAGVAMDEPISKDGQPLEITLTANQVEQVVLQLQAGTGDFTEYAFPSTAEKAGPRIPSPYVPGGHSEEAASEEGEKKPGKSFQVQGTFTIRPKAAAPLSPAETTSVDRGPAKATVTAKARAMKAPNKIPIEDDQTYRVRFLLKPAKKPAKEKAQTEE